MGGGGSGCWLANGAADPGTRLQGAIKWAAE